MEKAEQPVWTQTANEANKKLVLHVQLNHNTSVTSGQWIHCSKRIAWQVSLAAVNQILCCSWGYERLQNSKDSLKACFENVNIKE